MKVGIVGYGNLGKAIEEEIKDHSEFELVAIFSRRRLQNTESFSRINDYVGKIETLFVCVGSKTDLEQTSLKLIKNFNIVETFDNHAKIPEYHKKMVKIAEKHLKFAICSVGWDPGLFSLMRGLIGALGYSPYTFWGKGVSQGHTQAIKNLPGVIDGIEFTLPNKKALKQIKRGINVTGNSFHIRLCYVVADFKDQNRIRNQIVNMPDYFLGYKTIVKFVSQAKLNRLKTFKHRGEVLTCGNIINFSLNLPSNPKFTAKIAVTYAKSIKNLSKPGVYSIFDIPLSYIIDDKFKFL